MNALTLFLVVALCALVGCHEEGSSTNVEPRGKGKYALLIHFFYVVATKLFILKIVYGFIFYALLTKGWKFVLWFIQYLKKKDHHVEYVAPAYHGHHVHHDHHDHHDHYEPPHHSYGPEPYQAYSPYQDYDKQGHNYIPANKKSVYDSDGSYSVKNSMVTGY